MGTVGGVGGGTLFFQGRSCPVPPISLSVGIGQTAQTFPRSPRGGVGVGQSVGRWGRRISTGTQVVWQAARSVVYAAEPKQSIITGEE